MFIVVLFFRMSEIFSIFINPDFNSGFVKMIIERTLSGKIKQLSGKFPVISINGSRQSGKTTLAKLCFPDYGYVTPGKKS